MEAKLMYRIKEQLVRHEGLRLKPYRCTAGKLTIGIGRNLDGRSIYMGLQKTADFLYMGAIAFNLKRSLKILRA